ncbi:MAG: hypothetical protein U1E76_01220 [Planctomycetota bacterium]
MLDFCRRHLLTAFCVAAVGLLGAWVARTAAGARAIRRQEEEALRVIRAILACEQERAPTPAAAQPYLGLDQLLAGGSLARRHAAMLEADESLGGLPIYRASGYLFAVVLLDDQDQPAPVGRRFKAYAWPQSYGRTGTVFFYTDARGDIYQGENAAGRFSGQHAPFEEDPVRDQRKVKQHDLDEKQFRNRWRLFDRLGSEMRSASDR